MIYWYMPHFKDSVVEIVNKIPKGKVMSYGQVALCTGSPRAARQVGWVLSGLSGNKVPWWRVVNKDGVITIKNGKFDKNEQRQLLRLEGIEVGENYELDIEKYRFVED